MQEYADPVIDWLDAGRGIIGKRFFREVSLRSSFATTDDDPLDVRLDYQSCTQLPNGSYTKDLTIVEADLAKVCLVDNSPISYNHNEGTGCNPSGAAEVLTHLWYSERDPD